MPKRTKELVKSRQWEKVRRDRLKEKFQLLAKVLPCYDPNVRLCHEFILENARITIEELQDEVNKILSQKSDKIKETKDEQIKKLQDKIKKLLTRNEQLSKLLKDAGISLPKISNNDPKLYSKLVQNKKKKSKFITAVALKHRTEKKNADIIKPKSRTKKNLTTNCVLVLSQPTTVATGFTQPYYLITKPQNGNNFVTNKTSAVLPINNAGTQNFPLISINPTVKTLNPSTLFISNNSIVPQPQLIMPPSAPLIPLSNTITTINNLPKIITNTNILPQSQILIPQSGENTLLTPIVSSTNISHPMVSISTNILTSNSNPSPLSSTSSSLIPVSESTTTVLTNKTVTTTVESSKIIVSTIKSPTKTSISSVSNSIPTTLVSVTKTIPTPLVTESVANPVTSINSRIINTTFTSTAVNQKKIDEYMKKLPLVAPKTCSTKTTQVIKVPIPALTSKYTNNFTLLNVKKEVKVRIPSKTGVEKKLMKRQHEDEIEGVNKKSKSDEIKSVHISQNVLKEQNTGILSDKENNKMQCNNEKPNIIADKITGPDTECMLETVSTKAIENVDKQVVGTSDNENCENKECSRKVLDTLEKDTSTSENNIFNALKNSQDISKDQDCKPIITSKVLPTSVTTDVIPTCNAVATVICTVSEAQDDIKNLELNLVHSDLSNDIFASLQVPSGCQNPESTSPTAAFLLAFPLVSSLKVSEVMEEDNSESQRETPTLLQIGNLDVAKTTQSDTLNNSLLNLENFSFFSKNVCGDYYNSQFNLATNTPNSDAIKQLESGINYESFTSCIDRNNIEPKIDNNNISKANDISITSHHSKTNDISATSQNKNVNEITVNDNVNVCEKHRSLQENNTDKQDQTPKHFNAITGKHTHVFPDVRSQQTPVNVNNWSASSNFNVSVNIQNNYTMPKNQLVIEGNNIENQHYKTQDNNEPTKNQETIPVHKNSDHGVCKTQQKVPESPSHNVNFNNDHKNDSYKVHIGSSSSKQQDSIINRNKTNEAFISAPPNASSNLNVKYPNAHQEKVTDNSRKNDENHCNNQFVQHQFSNPKNDIVQSVDNKNRSVDNWGIKSNQEIKKKDIITKSGNTISKTLKSTDHQMLQNYNNSGNNQNINVWPPVHYQQKIATSGNIPVQNPSNDNQNIPQYVYQPADSTKKTQSNLNSQESTHQNFCEKHRSYSAVQYPKSQDLQFNTNELVQNLSNCNKDQSGSFWLLDSMQYNNTNTYDNSVPFNIYNDKSGNSKKHEIVNPENVKNSFQYSTPQQQPNSCSKKHNVWAQDWQDVNIPYNTFKDISNKDLQKQTNDIWPQEIVNYDKQNSTTAAHKYHLNPEIQLDNKKESVNTWPLTPMQDVMNNFQLHQGVPNIPYTHQQKPDQIKKENHNNNKIQNIPYGMHQDLSVPPKEIQNLVNNNNESVKPWLATPTEIQHYDKHRNEFNVQYNLHQEKHKEPQNNNGSNDKQNINSWPVYSSDGINSNIGKSCEKHRNTDFSHEDITASVPKNSLFQDKHNTNSSVGISNFGNTNCEIIPQKTDQKSNTHPNIPQTENNHFTIFLETPKEHIQPINSEKTNNTTNKTTDNYTVNYSKKSSVGIEHTNNTTNINKISDQNQLKQQQTQNSTKTLDHSQKEEQKPQCYFSTTYPNSSCNFNYKTDASKTCPTCSYAHLNRNYPNPLYTNSNNYSYNYPDPSFNQTYYKPPVMSKNDSNYYPFNYDNYQDPSKCYNNSNNFSKDNRKNNNTTKAKGGVSQHKPVNWMTTPENKQLQTSDCILPTFSNQSYSFTSCISNSEMNDQNDPKKSLEFPIVSEDKQFTWSPTKFPNFLDTSHNFVTPTLPTLVGDLALGNPLTFADQKTDYSKCSKDTKRKSSTCDNQSSNFLSVSQLVDHNKSDNNVPGRTTTRRNSGGRSKGSGTSKKNKSPKIETAGEKTNQNKQIVNNSSNSFGVEGQNELFYEQKPRSTSKHVSTNYSAEALIGNQGSDGATKKFPLPPNKTLGSSSFLTENIITYFPPVDENYVVPSQNLQNNTFSHNNFQNTVYSTNSFIYTASSITSTYLPSFDSNVTDFSTDNINLMASSVKDSGKTCSNKNFRQSNNKDDKQNNCTNNSKRTNKKKTPTDTTNNSSTGGTVLTNFDYPFLTVPGSTNSPILPEDFHAHNSFLTPAATPYSCKPTLYQKQPSDFNPNPLLPLPTLPRNSVQHPEVSPSINAAGTSFTNFNLSTIFPEINKGSTNIFQDSGVKESSNSVQVPFNVKRKYNFSS